MCDHIAKIRTEFGTILVCNLQPEKGDGFICKGCINKSNSDSEKENTE